MKPLTEQHLAIFRRHMVETIDVSFDLMSEEIGSDRIDDTVRAAFLRVPRHLFVPQQFAAVAYHDGPLPIGFDKTISQPFIAALMIHLLAPGRHDRILEIGTGLGYQAAILAELGTRIWTVEIVEELAEQAHIRLGLAGYDDIEIRVGDGTRGWPEYAPFDGILVTAAAEQPPLALLAQLKPTGRLIIPLGEQARQDLAVVEKASDGRIDVRRIIPVKFTELEMA